MIRENTMADEINIPDSAREVKAWYPDRPKPDVVREIKDFIKETGTPHLWRGHTHTKPVKGAPIVYLGEFDLPEAYHKFRERWAPCPCCVPNNPKYFRAGKIGYFPEEYVIRMLGPDCFRALNPEGHDRAYDDMKAEEQRESDINFLLSRIGDVPKLIKAVEHAIPVAETVDALGVIFRKELDLILRTRMWDHVREGQLHTSAFRNVPYRRPDGSEGSRPEEYFESFGGQLSGISFLNPRAPAIAPKLKRTLAALKAVKIDGPFGDLISEWRDDVRRNAAKTVESSIASTGESFDALDDMRQFFSPMNLATFKRWNSHEGCPTRIYMSYEGSNILVGREENHRRRFPVDSNFERVLRRPDILSV
jgi:hypothetical protein